MPLARAALDLGKPVVVDKPLALTSDDAARLVEHAARVRRPLGVFHNRRWDSDTLTAAELLASGALGDGAPARVALHALPAAGACDRWRERPGGGGVLLDLGTHLVDQAVHLLGPVARGVGRRARAARRRRRSTTTACSRSPTSRAPARCCGAPRPRRGPARGSCCRAAAPAGSKQDLDGQEAAQREGRPARGEPDGTLWDATAPGPCRAGRGTGRRSTAASPRRSATGRRRRCGPRTRCTCCASSRPLPARRASGSVVPRQAVLTADTSNSSVTLSLMSTPPVSSAAL